MPHKILQWSLLLGGLCSFVLAVLFYIQRDVEPNNSIQKLETSALRIASCSFQADGIIRALGLTQQLQAKSDGSTRLIGDAYFDILPVLPWNPQVERLLSLEIDLLIYDQHDSRSEWEKSLRASGFELVSIPEARGIDSLKHSVELIAERFSVQERGTILLQQLSAREEILNIVAKRIREGYNGQRPLALVLLVSGDTYFAGGKNSSYDDLLYLAGFENALKQEGWPQLSLEHVISLQPDCIIISDTARVAPNFANSVLSEACEEYKIQIRSLPDIMFNDPGLGLYDAAEKLQQLILR